MNKIWRIRGLDGKFSDEELIDMIKNNSLSKDDCICSVDMKTWMKIEDTIYQFYLGGLTNETL